MKTNRLIALAIANKSSNSKSIFSRFSRKTNHQLLIPVLIKSGNEITFLERFWSVLKCTLTFNTL